MTAPRINLVFIAIVVLLVACAGQTPTPTTPPQLSTPPVAPPTNPPVAVIPTLTPPPMFPVGLTSEPLAVVTTAPADKAEDIAVSPELTKIIVQFNHPVVPLVSVDAQKSLPQPLTFSPPVSGSGEWINTSTYSFTPSQSLAVATQYTVNVAALKDMLGQSLAGYSWSFKTASPTILKKYPEELTKFAGVTQPITFTFNTVMDRASTEARFSVTNTDKKTPVAGQLEWQGATARFVPAQPLDYDTHYQVTLKAGAQDANKVAATAKDISWSFTTTPAPGILSTSPADGDKASKDIRNGFTIHFKSPMARNAVTVSVVPTITNQSQYWEYDSNDTTLRVQGGWLASRSYTVTISGQSETRYGEKLGKDTVVRFTAAPLDPMVSLQTTGMMGLYDVNGPELIFANYVNVNRIDFQLSKVKTGDFLSLAGRQRYQIWEKYRPEESALLNKWSVTTQAPVNAMRLISTTLTSNGRTKLQPGVYYLEATSPEISLAQPARHLVVVTALNLALKRTQTEALVWVTDLKTGKPVVNQPLTIYGPNGDTLASGRSDSDGVFRAQFARQEAWDSIYVLSEQDGVIVAAAGSDWNEGINIWDFNMPGQPEAQEFFSNLYTDRAIYRPGQTVYFKGVLRRDKDASYSLPTDIETVPISVHDDQGKEVFSQNVPLSPFGTFNGQFALSPAASIGYYNISFELGQDPHKYFSSVGFQVAQYRAPEFQVEVKTDKPAYINGDTIKVDATSTYFFGGPVANAKVSWRLLSDDLFFNTDKVKGYWSFTDYDLTADRKPTGGVIREGKGTTDAQGNFHFQVPADLKDFPLSQNMTLDVEITDINNQAVSNRVTVPVHKGNFYIGMRPEEYVGSVGKEATVDLITVTPQGDPSPNQTVTVSFYEHKWYSVREKREDGNFYWRSAYTDTLISKVDVKTDAKGEATAKFTPPTGGVFKIAGEATDSAGNKIKSATYIWVTSEQFVNWRVENNDRIELVADKKQYNVGDTAEVLIPAPFSNSEALLTIERGTIRQVKRLTLPGNSETIKIPITSDFAPNVFVSVMLVKGRTTDSPTPQFKLGYANLAVATTEKELTLKVTPDRTDYQPGDKAIFTIEATDYQSKPVEAELSVAVVDKAIQSLADDPSQSLLQAFYGQRGLGVQTSASLVRSVDRVSQQLQQEAKGGGGGGAPEQPSVRRNFQDTAFWKADVTTDAQGRAQVSVTLPDNLTTWNLTAKAVTVQTAVGLAKTDIVSTKPLLIRPVAPRFFVVGDKTRLEAVVNNNTDKDVQADVRLDAQGLTLNSSAQQPLTVKARDKAKVTWDTVVNPADNVVVKFSATGGALQDALELTLPIVRPTSPELVGTAGQVGEQTAEEIRLPADADRTAGDLQIEVSPSLAAASTKSLEFLKAFPYDCAEQTVSKFFPNVATLLALQKLGLERPGLRAALQATVSTQVQRLYGMQNPDGGWGWWGTDASNPYITAYALYGLTTARDAGFSIDANVLDRAERFLVTYLDRPIDVKSSSFAYNQRAFVLFVLTEKGGAFTSRAVNLFDSRANLDLYGKAYLLMTLAKSKLAQADTLKSELTSAAIPSAAGAHWEEKKIDFWTMNTNTRTTAIVLMSLARTDPQNALLPNAVRWLMSVRQQQGHWETTQETAWSVLGLTEFMAATGELTANYNYEVTVNGKTVGSGTVDKSNVDQPKTLSVAIKDLLQSEGNKLLISRTNDTGNLYYTAYLNYFLPADKIGPLNKGVLVGRQYFAVDQQTLKPTDRAITTAKVGEYVQVRLTIIAPTDMNYLVLEDPLPAGFEAVDKSLKTATAAAASPELKPGAQDQKQAEPENDYDSFYFPYWYFWGHSEVRDDRVAAFAYYLPRGTYEYSYMMRASVTGEFRALPARAWQMYFPDVFGRSAGMLFTVTGE